MPIIILPFIEISLISSAGVNDFLFSLLLRLEFCITVIDWKFEQMTNNITNI